MKCYEIRGLLHDYLAEELDDECSRMVKEHISGCVSCRKELEVARKYCEALAGVEKVSAPVNFFSGVRKQIEEPGLSGRIKSSLLYPLRVKVPLEAAGLAVLVLVAVFVFRPFDTLKAPSPVAVTDGSVSPDGFSGKHSGLPLKKQADVMRINAINPGEKPARKKSPNESPSFGASKIASSAIEKDYEKKELSAAAGSPSGGINNDISDSKHELYVIAFNAFIVSPEIKKERLEYRSREKTANRKSSEESDDNYSVSSDRKSNGYPSMAPAPKKQASAGSDAITMVRDAVISAGGKIISENTGGNDGKVSFIIVELPGKNISFLKERLMKSGNVIIKKGPEGEEIERTLRVKIEINE